MSKRARLYILGIILLLGSIPAGIMTEVSINFSETRVWGIGYFLMAIMFIAGLVLTIKAIRMGQAK
jgi:hypothetical protein